MGDRGPRGEKGPVGPVGPEPPCPPCAINNTAEVGDVGEAPLFVAVTGNSTTFSWHHRRASMHMNAPTHHHTSPHNCPSTRPTCARL